MYGDALIYTNGDRLHGAVIMSWGSHYRMCSHYDTVVIMAWVVMAWCYLYAMVQTLWHGAFIMIYLVIMACVVIIVRCSHYGVVQSLWHCAAIMAIVDITAWCI